jgi:hypothetical protein
MDLRRQIRVFLFLVTISTFANGQTTSVDTVWTISVGGIGNETPIAIRRSSSGNLFVVGNQTLSNPLRKYVWLALVTPSGGLAAMTNIDTSGIVVRDMEFLQTGELVLCGTKSDSLWLSKIDTTGAVLWSRVFLSSVSPIDFSVCDTNSIVVTGALGDSLFLAKVSSEGILRWWRVFPRNGYDVVSGTSVVQLANRKFVVGANFGRWMGDYMDTKAGVCVLDSSGGYESRYVYDAFGNTETTQRIAVTSSGNILTLGNILLGSIGYDDAFMRLINITTGQQLWYHEYGSYNLDYVYDMYPDGSDNIFVCGYTKGFGIPNNRDFWVFKCNPQGQLVWNFWMGFDPWESATSLTLLGGDVVFAGYTPNQPPFGYQTIIARLHETVTSVSLGDGSTEEALSIRSYPNPFNSSTVFDFTLSTKSQVRISVTDILGREVAIILDETIAPGRHQIPFDASALSSGIYFCRLQTAVGVVSRKVVFAK